MKEKRRNKAFLLLFMIILSSSVTAYIFIANTTSVGYEYHKNVRSHMENAYYANEPNLMKEELLAAIDGMHTLNLDEEMYGAFFYWEQTPDRKMDYQYRHLQGIIDRVDAVISWYDSNYASGVTGSESLGDVYEQKMDNLRKFIKEDGWSDWIAHDTYYANYHTLFYFSSYIMGLLWLITAAIFIFTGGLLW